MELKRPLFNRINNCISIVVLIIASFTYLSTIEPTVSFWDCGEFIASSYKLEVGHPPGNPVFQVIARFFTLFASPENAAMMVNAMSALCSALTIFFLYFTIVHLARRSMEKQGKIMDMGNAIGIFGAGIVGSLAYCWSDTFWFSAVEGEVYAMSSLFTAIVFWAMLKWEEQADQPYANRWIILIAFLMGLSIGVHLLNLLTIPALVFLYYFKKYEVTAKRTIKVLLLSVFILVFILYGIIPYVPKLAAYVDLFFVNVLGTGFNVGATIFVLVLLGLLFWAVYKTYRSGKVLSNTIALCSVVMIIGYSVFAVVVIRSSAMTPTNEYQPDNPFTLVRYLGREQYGSNPLIYGQYFDAPYDIEIPKYWAPLGDRYVKTDGQITPVYSSEGKMFFPRMWATSPDGRYEEFYSVYMDGKGKTIPGQTYKKPTFGANLKFFFDYQLNWMYWRYFMWNFAGRQNDIHSPAPGELFTGNWESGIGFIDKARLGDQSDAPAYLKDNRAKNHYYMLPLLLGIIGIFFQFARDKRGSWVTFLMFFMTGIAIVIYLNQPPYQVRERDYAYAGSFYAFSIWVGLAVLALYTWISRGLSGSQAGRTAVAAAVSAVCLGVPVLMAQQNWDDHDRSNRSTAVEMARNYLKSVGPQGILITHGDNDTFPLWYAQEVEEVRTDVRICNTSLLGTDWHIDQMKYACNESKPLPLTVGPEQYLYGTNEFIYIYDTRDTIIPISTVMDVFKHPKAKIELTSGRMVDYIMSRRISVPVNKENVIRYGILEEKYADLIPDEIVLTMPADKDYITKQELFMLDLLSNYSWDRPINLLNMGGDINIGIKDYLMYEGFSYKFVPVKNRMKQTDIGFADADDLYYKVNSVFCWDALKRTDYFADYQNFYTFCGVMSQRGVFLNVAKEQMKAGYPDRAVEVLDKCQDCVPESVYPLDISYMGFINERNVLEMIALYYDAGAPDKGLALAQRFVDELLVSAKFYMEFYDYARSNFEETCHYIFYAADILKQNGDTEEAEAMEKSLDDLVSSVTE